MHCRPAIILICCCFLSITTCTSRHGRSGSENAETGLQKPGVKMDNMRESHKTGTLNDPSKFKKLLTSAKHKYLAVKEVIKEARSAAETATGAVESVKKFLRVVKGLSSVAAKFVPWAGVIEATLAGFLDEPIMKELRAGFKEMKKEFEKLHIKIDDGFGELKNHINLVDYRSAITAPTAHVWERYQNFLADPSPQTIHKFNITCGHHSPETTLISLRTRLYNRPQLLMELVENSKYDGKLFDELVEEMLSMICEQLHYNFISRSHRDNVEKNVREIAEAVEFAEQRLSEGYWPGMITDIFANEIAETDNWDEVSSRFRHAKAKLGKFNRAGFISFIVQSKKILFFDVNFEISSRIYAHDGFLERKGRLHYSVFREMSNCTSWSENLRAEYSCDEPADNCMKTIDDRSVEDFVSYFYYQLDQPTYLIAYKDVYIKDEKYGWTTNSSNFVTRAYKIDALFPHVLFILAGKNCDENAATIRPEEDASMTTPNWVESMLLELESFTEQEEKLESVAEQEGEQESFAGLEGKQEEQTSSSTCLTASVYLILLTGALMTL